VNDPPHNRVNSPLYQVLTLLLYPIPLKIIWKETLMKPVYLSVAKYTIGIFVLTAMISFSVPAQQPTSEPVSGKAKEVNVTKADATRPDPAPIGNYVFPTHRERFDRYVKDTVGPFRLARTAVTAGYDQWRDTPEEWGQGMKGYGRRFASSFGRNVVQQSVTYGLDEAFGLDSSFRRSESDGFGARVKHAFLETITSRTKSGKRVLSAPRLAGVYTGAIVATETWYPDRYSYKDGLRIGTNSLITNFGINLVREFFINF
jgi:hypothetical protein